MAALLIILAALVLLFCGYVFYGSWLAKQWGIDPAKKHRQRKHLTELTTWLQNRQFSWDTTTLP